MRSNLQIVGGDGAGSDSVQLRFPEVLQCLARGLRGKQRHPSREKIGAEREECAPGGQLVKTLTQEFLLGLGEQLWCSWNRIVNTGMAQGYRKVSRNAIVRRS